MTCKWNTPSPTPIWPVFCHSNDSRLGHAWERVLQHSTSSFSSSVLTTFICCVCVHVSVCHGTYVEVRMHLARISYWCLLLIYFCWSCWNVPMFSPWLKAQILSSPWSVPSVRLSTVLYWSVFISSVSVWLFLSISLYRVPLLSLILISFFSLISLSLCDVFFFISLNIFVSILWGIWDFV